MPEYKQVNYKLPPSLVEALSAKAKEENRTATSLVIEALGQILGISPNSQPPRIDNELYEFTRELQQRIEYLEKRNIDEALYDRIYSIENRLESLESNIEKDIDKNIEEDIDKLIELPLGNPQKELLQLLESKPINEETSDSGANLSIQNEEFDREISHREVAALVKMAISAVRARHSRGQSISYEGIEYIPAGRKGKPKWKIGAYSPTDLFSELTDKSTGVEVEVAEPITKATSQELRLEEINSSQLLELLKRIDPNKRWGSRKLQAIRQSAKQKDRWQEINGYQFKWTGKELASSRAGHLWWLKSPNT